MRTACCTAAALLACSCQGIAAGLCRDAEAAGSARNAYKTYNIAYMQHPCET